jgi:membrane protease subunit (stomatin/prohibitin family)
MHYPEYREYRAMCDTIAQIIACGQRGIPYQIQNSPISPVTSTQIARQPIVQPAAQTAWRCPSCGTENNGKFCAGCGSMRSMPAPNEWKCFCGTVNTGKFCTECGTIQFNLKSIECSECSWTAEPGDTVIPTFCPNCGRRFNADDI